MNAGAIFAGDLSGVKTRILLAVLLGAGHSQAQIRETQAEVRRVFRSVVEAGRASPNFLLSNR